MNDDLKDRLRRLGVVKGVRKLKPAPPVGRPSATPDVLPDMQDQPAITADLAETRRLGSLLPGGYLEETSVGECFVLDKVYPLAYNHGTDQLSDLLQMSTSSAASFCQDERLRECDFRDYLFLDTETTGLSGAGTIAFMVGVAFVESGAAGEVLVVRQYFLRDHGDEPAMLFLLNGLLAKKKALVTFNGRSFDLPLLDNRYLMNRMSSELLERPHIDLLHPARRLYRRRLGSCALGALEQNLLGLQRTHEDVPGWLIPGLYHNYLRTGDARELLRVFYHNEIDMLSMVTLTSRVMRQFANSNSDDDPTDLFSLGKWLADLGMKAESERNLRMAAKGDLPLELYHQALHALGLLLKRDDRREEAVPVWQQIAATSFNDVEAHIELAKHYEWQCKDYDQALAWTHQALALVDSWRQTEQVGPRRAELVHRQDRLLRKLNTLSS